MTTNRILIVLYIHLDRLFAMSLPLHFQFEKLRLQGAIQHASDMDELKEVAGQLLDLYFMQKAATERVISEK